MTLEEVYEKYKHLDSLLSDEEWFGLGHTAPISLYILYDLWLAVKKAVTPLLHTQSGRDAHHDLREELLDALQYAKQAEMERRDLEGWFREAVKLADTCLHTNFEHISQTAWDEMAEKLGSLQEKAKRINIK